MFTVIDPIGLVPVYLPIAGRFAPEKRKLLIIYSCLIAFVIATGFLFAGKYLFKYLGVDFNALYIVGGVLIFLIGLDMIYTRPKRVNSASDEPSEGLSTLKEVAVFPLAIPMLSGPGTIAAMIMFSSKHDSLDNYLVILSAILVSFICAALAMRFSDAIAKGLGKVGINVMEKIIGIVLCSLAIQFIINAIKNLSASMR